MISNFKYKELTFGMTWSDPAPDTNTLAFGAVLGVGLHAAEQWDIVKMERSWLLSYHRGRIKYISLIQYHKVPKGSYKQARI